MPKYTSIVLLIILINIILFGCKDVTNISGLYVGNPLNLSIFTSFINDGTNDMDNESDTTPDGVQYFDEIDFLKVSSAVLDNRIYVYVEVVGTLNATSEKSNYNNEYIIDRTINIGFDLDNNLNTGFTGWGMDLQLSFYLRSTSSSGQTARYGVYQNNENDTHVIERLPALIHNGGEGNKYVVFSAPISAVSYLNTPLSKGSIVKIIGWAEAESTNYHHFAFDNLKQNNETLIETTLNGN